MSQICSNSFNRSQKISYQFAENYDSVTTSKKPLKFLYANVRRIVKPGKLDESKCVIKSSTVIVTVDEVSIIIDNLNINTCSGIDEINPKSTKCIKNIIL